jgi:hypothetical protein
MVWVFDFGVADVGLVATEGVRDAVPDCAGGLVGDPAALISHQEPMAIQANAAATSHLTTRQRRRSSGEGARRC